MQNSKSLKRITTLANIRHSLTELNIFNQSKSYPGDKNFGANETSNRLQHEESIKKISQSKFKRSKSINKLLIQKAQGSQSLDLASSPKKFEPNIKIQRKRDNPQSYDIQKKQYIETLIKSSIDRPVHEENKEKLPTQQRPKKKIINFGQMAFGGKQSEGKKIAKQKIDLQKKKKAKADKKQDKKQKLKQNSWIHLSEKGTNQYMPTVLPFFNSFDAQRQNKNEIKRMKQQGKDQREIEEFLIKIKSQQTSSKKQKTVSEILADNMDPENGQVFHIQMPVTLPLQTELSSLPAGKKLGKLLVMKSGKVKMVLQNGLEFDVNRGIEAVFYQEGMRLISQSKKLEKLGQISNKCIVSPNLESLFR